MYPKRQFVLARKRGSRVDYFYGPRLKDLREHVKDGEEFEYFTLNRGPIGKGCFKGDVLCTS